MEGGGGDYHNNGDLSCPKSDNQNDHVVADEDPADEECVTSAEKVSHLPMSRIAKIMRKALPKDAKISKDASIAIQQCTYEFISFVTSEANDACVRQSRAIMNGEDLIFALRKFGFEKYIGPLTLYLQKYREYSNTIKGTPSGKVNQGGAIFHHRNVSSNMYVPSQVPRPAVTPQYFNLTPERFHAIYGEHMRLGYYVPPVRPFRLTPPSQVLWQAVPQSFNVSSRGSIEINREGKRVYNTSMYDDTRGRSVSMTDYTKYPPNISNYIVPSASWDNTTTVLPCGSWWPSRR